MRETKAQKFAAGLIVYLLIVFMINVAYANMETNADINTNITEDTTLYVDSVDGLKLRKSPSMEAESLLTMPDGAEVTLLSTVHIFSETWYYIDYDGNSGYAYSKYLKDLENELHNRLTYIGKFSITAYTATGNPCANGNFPVDGQTVACNSLELGTQIYIEGVGYRTVEDRGPSSMGNEWVDLYLETFDSCVQWGIQYRDVYVVEE